MKRIGQRVATRARRRLDPKEVALKSLFLGPQAENAPWVEKLTRSIFKNWFSWRRSLYPEDGLAITKGDQRSAEFKRRQELLRICVKELSDRFEQEVPSFSPRYAGHMFSETSIPALLGHIITLIHNPNNISDEVSRVGLEIEQEAISALMGMVGYDSTQARGHFTSGGTVANVEGLVRARYRFARWISLGACERELGLANPTLFQSSHRGWDSYDKVITKIPGDSLERWNMLYANPFRLALDYERIFGVPYRGPVVLVTSSKHYSWPKGILLLGLSREAFWPVELDRYGKLSIPSLKKSVERAQRENRPILMLVTVAGTTELGDFDPIDLVEEYLSHLRHHDGIHIYHHVDAAYGGFFCTLPRGEDAVAAPHVLKALSAIQDANSVTIDPHKLGYVPYSSGTFLAREAREYYVAPFDAPYLRFEGQSGPQTLDGSRSAGGAAATWLTSKTIGLGPDGYGLILERTIENRQKFERLLTAADPDIRIAPFSDTNIVCFCVARNGEPVSQSNERSDELYNAFSTKREHPFYLSKTALKWPAYQEYLDNFISSWDGKRNTDSLIMVRMCLMNPFFGSEQTDVRYAESLVEQIKLRLES